MSVTTDGALLLHLGKAHEEEVKARLIERGWDVQPWGQGLLTDSIRASLLRQYPKVLWRWIPDLIAARGQRLVLVDPKTELRSDTPFFSIAQDAYIAHHAMSVLGLRIVYVFADFSCNTVEGLKIARYSMVGEREQNGGSGTPYILVRKEDQHPFEALFG